MYIVVGTVKSCCKYIVGHKRVYLLVITFCEEYKSVNTKKIILTGKCDFHFV